MSQREWADDTHLISIHRLRLCCWSTLCTHLILGLADEEQSVYKHTNAFHCRIYLLSLLF